MIRQPVLSSNLKSVGYDEPSKTLEVEFHDGGVYHYHDVHPQEHHALMTAASIGRHFHAHVKHRHVGVRR